MVKQVGTNKLLSTMLDNMQAEINEKAVNSELSAVATSGSYNDLTDKPTIAAAYTHPATHPEFSSQTKEKLVVNKAYFDELMENFSKSLVKYLTDNIDIAQQLVKRFEEYRLARSTVTP